MRYYRGEGWGWGPWLGMALMMVVVLVVAAWVVVTLVRHGGPRDTSTPPPAPPRSAATAILDERFARGEIDAEEYTQRRTLLQPGGDG